MQSEQEGDTQPPWCQLCLGILQNLTKPCEGSVVPAQPPKGCTLLGPGTWFKCSSLSAACLRSAITESGHTLDNVSIHVQVCCSCAPELSCSLVLCACPKYPNTLHSHSYNDRATTAASVQLSLAISQIQDIQLDCTRSLYVAAQQIYTASVVYCCELDFEQPHVLNCTACIRSNRTHLQVPATVMLHSAILWRKLQSKCPAGDQQQPDQQQPLSDELLLEARTIKHVVQSHVFKVAKEHHECYSGPVRPPTAELNICSLYPSGCVVHNLKPVPQLSYR